MGLYVTKVTEAHTLDTSEGHRLRITLKTLHGLIESSDDCRLSIMSRRDLERFIDEEGCHLHERELADLRQWLNESPDREWFMFTYVID